MKDNILIIYICTGKYSKLLKDFNKHIINFLPGTNKTIFVLSNKFDGYPMKILDQYTNEFFYHIDHNPWPIPTLLKFHYIKDFTDKLDNQYSHVFYLNANALVRSKSNRYWYKFKYLINKYDLIFPYHALMYYKNHNTNYIQAGFFGGKIKVIRILCNLIINKINQYLKDCHIPPWHDETVLNEVLPDFLTNKKLKQYKIFKSDFMSTLEDNRKNSSILLDLINKDLFFDKSSLDLS